MILNPAGSNALVELNSFILKNGIYKIKLRIFLYKEKKIVQ